MGESPAEAAVIKTLVRHIADDPKGAISVLQDAFEAARAQEREEIVTWLRRSAWTLAEHAVTADAIASLQHKEAGNG